MLKTHNNQDAFPETADIETASDDYAGRFAGAVGAWMLKIQEIAVLDLLKEHPGVAVLDVGGGHGQLAGPLCREHYPVTVVGSAEVCRRRIAAFVDARQCRFQAADILKLPFADRSFDTVLCFRLVTHCARWEELIGELCRVAARAVIVDYPTSQSLNRAAPRLFGAKKKLEGNTRAFRLFRHDEIAGAFARHSFVPGRRSGQFFLPMVLHRRLKCRPLSAALEGLLRQIGLVRRWGSPVVLEMRRREPDAARELGRLTCEIPAATRVLVTGATGFTGAILARKLVNSGLEVHAIARASSNLEALHDLPIVWHRGNVFDEAVVAEAAQGVDYIFHVAAAYREARHNDAMYRQVHVLSTQLLARAALKNPAFKRFVHVSTVGVHGHIANPPADELYSMHPGDIYQQTKAEAELWLRDFAQKKSLPYTVIRPAAIYGPGDKRLLKFFRMAARPILFLLGRGQCLYHLIHVDDLTDIMILAATHPAARDEIFICGNPDCVTLDRMARIVADELGSRFRLVRLPAFPFFLAADVCEWVCRKLGVEPPIHRRRLAFFTKDRSFNTRKLREKLGYQTRYSNEAGLIQTARWYCEQGWLKRRRGN
ncbi:MAG: NAD-dependent epimerase/dehydratase family protein [Kiritimatiellia bacterium]|jgi:nucleoside-diphosphate-sugar epimerase/2-polyprenyl-3-methyl-5-hydroxy-6-metoxy-1,4-benzoquinol methylase